jgi:hypothetical protein
MAQIEIGQLPLTTSIVNSTQIPVENANVTQKIEASAIRDFITSVPLSSLTVSGNINVQNLIASQNLFGTLLTGFQPHITSVGTLANLISTGNILGANIVASANLYASHVIGNGSLLTGLPAGYTNANVDSYLPTYTGNISAGNIAVANTFVTGGNARVGAELLVSGQTTLNSTTRVNGNLVAAVETLSVSPTTGALVIAGAGGLGVGGAINAAGNISTNANINVTANITTGNISGTNATFTSLQGSGALLTNIPNSALVNSSITVNGSSVSLGGSVTIAGGVVSVTGTAFQVTGNTTQGNILLSLPQSIGTANSVQFGSFGVGTPASGTTGEIRATNNITAYYSSDARFKENIRIIPDALGKVVAIGGKLFDWTDEYIKQQGGTDDYFMRKQDFGVVAQDVLAVFPEAVRTRADGSLAVDYEKLSALAFAAITELKQELDHIKSGLKS